MAAPAPNFNNLAQSYVDIVRGLQAQEAELMKLQNLPALNVQQTLHQIQQTLAAMLANQANFATQLAEIATRARHSKQNLLASFRNSFIPSDQPTAAIHPLVNELTGAAIPGFPATPQELSNLSVPQIHPILQELEVPIIAGEGLLRKRNRLRVAIGMASIS